MPTAVEEENITKIFSLKQNYPNPFNPSTIIEFTTVGQDNVSLKIYYLLGREIAVLVNGKLAEGRHQASWHAENNSSGMYFCRLRNGSKIETKKMILLR